MRRKNKQINHRLSSIVKKTKSGIHPFEEKPSEDKISHGGNGKDQLQASDLFSLFTANIIKEDKPFTR